MSQIRNQNRNPSRRRVREKCAAEIKIPPFQKISLVSAFVEKNEKRIKDITAQLQRLLEGYLDQDIEKEIYRAEKAKLLSEKKSLEEEISKNQQEQKRWLEPASWRKNSPSRRRRESEFVWKNGGKSVGRASRVPPSGCEKAVKFCFGARERI